MKIFDLLVPRIPANTIFAIIVVTFLGALMGGAYGIVHDQITYSISREYFTRLKFDQFHYARPADGSERWFAARIGFIASCWVGALTAWVLARVSIRRDGSLPRPSVLGKAFAIVFFTSMIFGVGGYVFAQVFEHRGYSARWLDWMAELRVSDVSAFIEVAFIHNASYLGGAVGIVLGLLYSARSRREDLPNRVGDL